ncbi:hypothetical protein RM780_07750 [Streptomyces sp. DSM 44917]|uniref:DUF4352 domain-containing protein n=1 Tax=Streptomyces boetiae TaxID=3075541 RepID=A0ABU2L5M4_9ACTN|nr:hypothetical protein [Streptomyces sp. DSM 44917]MDT0306856.1 hypothetical protein [Streptomyces sp. DSM 44917]
MTRTRTATTLAALLLATGTAACSSSDDGTDGNTPPPAASATEQPDTLPFGQTHTVAGLNVTAEITEIFAPNDYANFDDNNPYALITITATNTGDADTDTAAYAMHQCQLDGNPTTYEQFQGITDMPPGLIQAGADSTWRAAACPVTTAGDPGTALEYGITLGETTVWYTGDVPAE